MDRFNRILAVELEVVHVMPFDAQTVRVSNWPLASSQVLRLPIIFAARGVGYKLLDYLDLTVVLLIAAEKTWPVYRA